MSYIVETLTLKPENNARLNILCGHLNSHISEIEKNLNIEINSRGNLFEIKGNIDDVNNAINILKKLYNKTKTAKSISPADVHLMLQGLKSNTPSSIPSSTLVESEKHLELKFKKTTIAPHTSNQIAYIKNIMTHDVNFSIGPAGTGKTFLAVACAVEALERGQVSRIVLVRPAVEAGEHLGFLPGDISQKVDPYLRPLYDALYEMLGSALVERLLAEHVIEIAPLAFMRGRTLNASFIILDESQNTTIEQMKMLLTRIGFNSKAVITGDVTQIDLANNRQSGLIHAVNILKNEPQISFTYFQTRDVVRHPLVQKIIEAYERAEKK